MSIEGVYEWFAEQVKYALFLVLLVLLIVTAFKRAWIAMVGVIVGLTFIAIFIIDPDVIITLGTWLTEKLDFGS